MSSNPRAPRRRRVTVASPGQRRNSSITMEILRAMAGDCRFPCCLPQRRVLARFSSLLEGLPNLYLIAWIGRVFRVFSASLQGHNERISLRAGRLPNLVSGGGLGMALPAAGRGVDRLRKRGGGEGDGPAFGGSVAIERRALARLAAEPADHLFHALGRHFLAVHGTGRTGDALVHQGAAEIIGAGLEAEGG